MANSNYDAAGQAADRTIIALSAVLYNIHQQQMAQMERMQTQHTVDTYRLRGVPEARIRQALQERDEYQTSVFVANHYAKTIKTAKWAVPLHLLVLRLIGAGYIIYLLHMSSGPGWPPYLQILKPLVVLLPIALLLLRSGIKYETKCKRAQECLPHLTNDIAQARARGVPDLYIP